MPTILRMRGHVRLAAVLAHTVNPHPTTCRLRAAVLMPAQLALPHLAGALDHALRHCGLDDLGAGVYERGDERWLATYLPADVLVEVFAANPLDLPDESIAVSLRPDVELGATAIRITAADPRTRAVSTRSPCGRCPHAPSRSCCAGSATR